MKKLYIITAIAIALSACTNDDEIRVDEPVAAQISATIDGSVLSRASETSWTAGDQIGVTMVGRYDNVLYTTETDDGNFDGATIYFKNKREPVTLTAYYPFAGTDGTTPEPIEASTTADNQTAEKHPGIDFLYAVKENVTGADPEVEFEFSHKMSQLTLTFKNGNDGTNVSRISSYEISGLVLDGTFDTSTGVCAIKDGVEAAPLNIPVPAGSVTAGEALPSLILFPQDAPQQSVTLKITDNENQEFSCKLNFKDECLMAGNKYRWTITVSKTGLVVNESSITPWSGQDMDSDAESVLQ